MPDHTKEGKMDKIRYRFHRWVTDLIFPIECAGCGKEGEWICKECYDRLDRPSYFRCSRCHRRTNEGAICFLCSKKLYIDGILAAGDYNHEIVYNAIHYLKFYFVKDISVPLASFLEESFASFLCSLKRDKDILLTPISLHPKRKKWRGFNQSEKIARELCQRFDLECHPYLHRMRYNTPQAKLDKNSRWNNISNSFQWKGEGLSGKKVIVVDDVVTTGATLEECARTLKKSGAKKVSGLVVAKG